MLYKKLIGEMNLFENIIKLDSDTKLYSSSRGSCNSTMISSLLLYKLLFNQKHNKNTLDLKAILILKNILNKYK